MSLNFVSHRQQFCRIRHVTDFIGENLDEAITLDDLANVAHLSPSHLVRFYSHRVGEAPMQTLRRLRLKRAFTQISDSCFGRLSDIACAAGYGSNAAFTHAFRKQFGIAPSEVSLLLPATIPLPRLRLEHVPDRKVWQFSYSGAYSQNGYYKARMNWLLHKAERDNLRTWRVNDRDHPFSEACDQQVTLTHFVPLCDQSMSLDEADFVTLRSGLYAVIESSPTERDDLFVTLAARIREELGCEIIESCTLDRDLHERAFRAPQERRIEVYIPVAPISALGVNLREKSEAMTDIASRSSTARG